jgi:hypothetical protein
MAPASPVPAAPDRKPPLTVGAAVALPVMKLELFAPRFRRTSLCPEVPSIETAPLKPSITFSEALVSPPIWLPLLPRSIVTPA